VLTKVVFYYLLYKTEQDVFPKHWQIILIVHSFIDKHTNTHTSSEHTCMHANTRITAALKWQYYETEEYHIIILFVWSNFRLSGCDSLFLDCVFDWWKDSKICWPIAVYFHCCTVVNSQLSIQWVHSIST